MPDLLLYKDRLKIEQRGEKKMIYCSIRNKWLVLQAEEIVRQVFLIYLIENRNYSRQTIAVEKTLKVHGLNRRYDILIFEKSVYPHILVECKSMFVDIDQSTMEQVSHYNLSLQVKFLVLTNGKSTFVCERNVETGEYEFIDELPRRI